MHDALGDVDSARSTLNRALRLPRQSNNPHLLFALGLVEARASDFPAARLHFESTLAAAPWFVAAYRCLGRVEEELGRYAAAREHYARGATVRTEGTSFGGHGGALGGVRLEGTRGTAALWCSWATMERRLGRFSTAARLYDRAAMIFPTDPWLYLLWAEALEVAGDVDAARAVLKRALALPEPPHHAYAAAAGLEARAGEDEAARHLFTQGGKVEPVQTAAPPKELGLGFTLPFGRRDKPSTDGLLLLLVAHAQWEAALGYAGCVTAARELFDHAEAIDAAAPTRSAWLLRMRAQFEADAPGKSSAQLARHYFTRAVNEAPADAAAWNAFAAFELAGATPERANVYAQRAAEAELLSAARVRDRHPLRRKRGAAAADAGVEEKAWGGGGREWAYEAGIGADDRIGDLEMAMWR